MIPEIPTIPPERSLYQNTWKMEDYLLITKDYFSRILGESSDDWSISQIDTSRYCRYFDKGYSAINFTFFKESNQNDDYFRLVYLIHIVPSGNYI